MAWLNRLYDGANFDPNQGYPASGYGMGSSPFAQRWRDRQQQMLASGTGDTWAPMAEAGGIQTGQPAIQPPGQVTPLAATPIASGPGAGKANVEDQRANQVYAAQTAGASGSGKGAVTNGKPDPNYDPVPAGYYFSGLAQPALNALVNDPEEAIREWANYTGYGGDAYASTLSKTFQDPMSLMTILGYDTSGSPQDTLAKEQYMMSRLSGQRKAEGGLTMTLDPRTMVANIFNSAYDETKPANSVGNILNAPGLTPDQQVANVLGLLQSAFKGVISDQAYSAWLSMLNRFGKNWQQYMAQHPDQQDNQSFIQAIRQHFGSGAGLF